MGITVDGWRLFPEGDWVAIDNRPAVEQAKREGRSEPELQHVVLDMGIFTAFADHVVKSRQDATEGRHGRSGRSELPQSEVLPLHQSGGTAGEDSPARALSERSAAGEND